MDIKLLVMDLDDTLISETSGITQKIKNTIDKVKEKGIKVSIATGRMHSSAFPFAEKLDISEPIITYNGALIKYLYSNEPIVHWPVSYGNAMQVMEFARMKNRFVQYYSQDEFYIPEHNELSDLYGRRTGRRAVETKRDLMESLDFDPTKLLIIAEDAKTGERIYNEAKEKFSGILNITRSSDTYVEFNNIKASKGAACEILAKHYGYGLNNVMSIGNGGNDVDMIERCGLGVAVGNATQKAKDAADYVCPPQDEDGALYAIERFLLNR